MQIKGDKDSKNVTKLPCGAHESLNPPQSDKVANADKYARDLN